MKLLLTPPSLEQEEKEYRIFTQSLIDLFLLNGHEVAVCSKDASQYHYAVHYPSPTVKKPFFSSRKEEPNRTYEEALLEEGVLQASFLEKDLLSIQSSIQDFQPDCVIDLQRVMTPLVSRMMGCRCISIVHAGMTTIRPFPKNALQGFQQILTKYGFPMVSRMEDYLRFSDQRLVFSPSPAQPFDDDFSVIRFGSPFSLPLEYEQTTKLYLHFQDDLLLARKLTKIIEQAFLGAPYEVKAWYPGCPNQTKQNIQYLTSSRYQEVNTSCVCIHDGSDLLFHYALSLGIPQLIVSTGDWKKGWNANALQRLGVGISIPADALSMESLYESYRYLRSDEQFLLNAQRVSQEILSLGGLDQILTVLP